MKPYLIFQRAEQLTPYPQPRFYDPLSSRTFDRSQDKSRSNSKRFHFGNHNHNHGNHGNHGSHNNNNRENRLLATQHNHGGHDQHHQHHNEIIERIDEVIELVDCGGRDLGFCDMSSKYPGSVFATTILCHPLSLTDLIFESNYILDCIRFWRENSNFLKIFLKFNF